jgi:hypothetical protein
MKLHIVVPTIMTNPKQEFKCLDQLVEHFSLHNLDFKIYFVANVPLVEFNEYIPTDSRISKSISHLEFSISRALNSIFETIKYGDEDILGFVQSDTFIDNPNWIIDLINILNTPEYKAGVLGLRPHSSSNRIGAAINYQGKFNIHPARWTDGVMLFKGRTYSKVGPFDENYFGDCESQDFCYTADEKGFINYWCSDDTKYFGYTNKTVHFSQKARHNVQAFQDKVAASREYLNKKWNK